MHSNVWKIRRSDLATFLIRAQTLTRDVCTQKHDFSFIDEFKYIGHFCPILSFRLVNHFKKWVKESGIPWSAYNFNALYMKWKQWYAPQLIFCIIFVVSGRCCSGSRSPYISRTTVMCSVNLATCLHNFRLLGRFLKSPSKHVYWCFSTATLSTRTDLDISGGWWPFVRPCATSISRWFSLIFANSREN